MNQIIIDNIEKLKDLCIKYEVKSMYVFGSAANGEFNENSDIDVLISFKDLPYERYTDNYFNLEEDLITLFKRHVDLLTENFLSNPYLIQSINKSKELLYAACNSYLP